MTHQLDDQSSDKTKIESDVKINTSQSDTGNIQSYQEILSELKKIVLERGLTIEESKTLSNALRITRKNKKKSEQKVLTNSDSSVFMKNSEEQLLQSVQDTIIRHDDNKQ